jgi:hypothetical protein
MSTSIQADLLPERLLVEVELPANLAITPRTVDECVAFVASRARWMMSQRYKQQVARRVQDRVAARLVVPT